MKQQLTEKEAATVKSLISLGDSEALAIKTVINERPTEAMKQAQLEDWAFINN